MRRAMLTDTVAAIALFLAPAATAVAQEAQGTRSAAIAQARAANARGDHALAITILDEQRAAHGGDAEILRLLGSSHAYAGHHAEAVAILTEAQRLSPDDLDIQAALARAYLWSGNRADAEAVLAAIERRDPANAEIAAIRLQMKAVPGSEAAPARPRSAGAYANLSVADLSLDRGANATWWTTAIGVFAQAGAATTLSAEAEREDRSGTVDTRLTFRGDRRLGRATGYVGLAITPKANFRERWSVRSGVEVDVGSGVTPLVEARHARYGGAEVTVIEPGLRLASLRLRSAATVRMISLWDEGGTRRTGWSGRVDSDAFGPVHVFAGAATYPETEAAITRQVRSGFFGTLIPLGGSVSLRAVGEYEQREETYTRKSFVLGLDLRL